jgi:hypothetical protein
MGKELFAHRYIDEDTRILEEKYRRHDGYDLLMEQWVWDGMEGNSIIFLTRQVAGLSDFSLEDLAREIADLDLCDHVTLKREKGFTYVNYGFRS